MNCPVAINDVLYNPISKILLLVHNSAHLPTISSTNSKNCQIFPASKPIHLSACPCLMNSRK